MLLCIIFKNLSILNYFPNNIRKLSCQVGNSGIWSASDLTEFEKKTKDLRSVNPEDWQ